MGVGAKDLRVEVGFAEEGTDDFALFDEVLAGNDGVFVGFDAKGSDGGVETEGFANDLNSTRFSKAKL